MGEKRSEFPLWLEFSGLPEFVNTKARKEAWSVFKKVVELDCSSNVAPGVVEISLKNLALRTGLSPETVARCLEGLRKKKLLACFVPDNFDEKALFRVVIPLETPVPPEEIKQKRIDLFPLGEDFFRYVDHRVPQPRDDETLQEIIDLYFNSIGLKMNLFILDELRLLRQRFELSDIKKAFEAAKRIEIKSLRWVIRQLLSWKKKDAEKKGRKRKRKKSV